MNAKQLRDKVIQLRLDADAKRKQAERFSRNADDYDKVDDRVKADVERTEAAKLIADAERAEQEAQEHERTATDQESRADQIKNEQASLQSQHDQRMKELEHERAQLLGSASLL